jgi:hypothetical protein
VQRRGFVDTDCVFHLNPAIKLFSSPYCYDRLPRCPGGECVLGNGDNRRPFGIMADRSRYFFQSFTLPSLGLEEGYFQFFPVSNETAARAQMAVLKKDRWADRDVQWMRVDFPVLGGDEALLMDFRMFVDVDPGGRVRPFVLADVFRLSWYDFSKPADAVRVVLEVLSLLFWWLQIYDSARDFLRFRRRYPGLSRMELWGRCVVGQQRVERSEWETGRERITESR